MSRTKAKKPGAGRRKGLIDGKRKAEALDEEATQPKKKVATDALVTSRPKQTDYDQTLSMMDPSLLSDHFGKATQRFPVDSTAIELEDRYISSKAFVDTSSFKDPRLAENIALFVKAFTEGGETELCSCDAVSSPHTLVLTVAAIRATDLVRELRVFGTEQSKIAKLFAKHMKLKQIIAYVSKTSFGIGIGTPSRINELVKQDVMKTGKLKRIVIDGSYIDEKKRTIFDVQEVFLPLLEMLNLDNIKGRFQTGDLKILVF